MRPLKRRESVNETSRLVIKPTQRLHYSTGWHRGCLIKGDLNADLAPYVYARIKGLESVFGSVGGRAPHFSDPGNHTCRVSVGYPRVVEPCGAGQQQPVLVSVPHFVEEPEPVDFIVPSVLEGLAPCDLIEHRGLNSPKHLDRDGIPLFVSGRCLENRHTGLSSGFAGKFIGEQVKGRSEVVDCISDEYSQCHFGSRRLVEKRDCARINVVLTCESARTRVEILDDGVLDGLEMHCAPIELGPDTVRNCHDELPRSEMDNPAT